MHQVEQAIEQAIEGGNAERKSRVVGREKDQKGQKNRRNEAIGQAIIRRGEQQPGVEIG